MSVYTNLCTGSQEQLDYTAKHDTLTDLPNRFVLNELLQHFMSLSDRKETIVCVLYLDLDGFKFINDQYGHETGDIVLTQTGHRMKNVMRKEDLVSRIGGDEFAMVLTELKNQSDVLPFIERLLHDLSQPISCFNTRNEPIELRVTTSIGVTFYPQKATIGSDALLRQADQAMYQAKTDGKNTYRFFSIDESEAVIIQNRRIARFQKAIIDNELELHYQPKVEMNSCKVIGFEALLRWQHPEEGLLTPDKFLPLINNHQEVMLKLGDWVFNRAFQQINEWNQQAHYVNISLNVSTHELYHKDLKNYLRTLLKAYPSVSANQIELEILETHALKDTHTAMRVIQECQSLGIKISLDDFGTGYSTLSYLKSLPVNTLKIDRSFVTDMLHDNASFSIMEAAMGLAQAFRCSTIAEGVESVDQGIMLLKLGCQIAQGYVISKPMPANQVLGWLSQWRGIEAWQGIDPVKVFYREVLYAENQHRNWMKALTDHLSATDTHPFPILNPQKCAFGQWLMETAPSILTQEQLSELEKTHNEFHQLANALNEPANQEDLTYQLLHTHQIHEKRLKQLQKISTEG